MGAGPGTAAAEASVFTAGTLADAMRGLSCLPPTPTWPPVPDRTGFGAMPYDGCWAVTGFPCPVGVGSSTISFAVQFRSNGSSVLTRLHQRITASMLLLPLTSCNRTPLGVRIWAAQQGSRGCGDRAGRRFWGRRCGRGGPVSCLRVRMCFVIRTLRNGRGLTVIGGPGAQSVADRENVIDTHHRV